MHRLSNKSIIIILMAGFICLVGAGPANAALLPEGVLVAHGTVSRVDSNGGYIQVDNLSEGSSLESVLKEKNEKDKISGSQQFFFTDKASMRSMLEKNSIIGFNEKVTIFYKEEGDKKIVVNIKIEKNPGGGK